VTQSPSVSRAEAKERTRRAILDAVLELTQDAQLATVSLRQIAKEVGIVPTAFYRHFPTVEDLGLTLVDESFISLRAMLREARDQTALASPMGLADTSVSVLVDHVHRHRSHFAFIARERAGAAGPVREAIRHEIDLCERELATDLARLPDLSSWPTSQLHALSGLIVTMMVTTAEDLTAARPEHEAALTATARTQLRMIVVGALHWKPTDPA
jgi:AcrR family transcriptional regulator